MGKAGVRRRVPVDGRSLAMMDFEFDFASAMKDAVTQLDDDERAKVVLAVDRLGAVIAQHEQSTALRLEMTAVQLAESLQAKAVSGYEAVGEAYDEEMDLLRAEADDLSLRIKALEKTADDLRMWLHPVWGELPRKVYLGVSALVGLAAGAGMIILLGSLERRSLEGRLAGLERQSAAVARNLDQFEAMAGFAFLRDGDQIVMAVSDGFKIEKYVSVRGIFSRDLANAYRVVPK